MKRTEKAQEGFRASAISFATGELKAAIAAMERAEPGSRAELRAETRLAKAKLGVEQAKERWT
jgi:hypothetical protein